MKKIIITALAAFSASALAVQAQDVPQIEVNKGFSIAAPALRYAGTVKMKTKAVSETPLFTADVPEARGAVWSDNFDKGITEWTFDPTQYVTWTSKATTGDKAFSKIDANDKASLYVEGPYQTYRREISSATSKAFSVPYSAQLHLYVGMSLNYDDVCRLLISVSDDDFETSETVWNSKDATGDRPWAWREVSVDLSDWAGKTVKIRLTYSWGSKDEGFQTGGYQGDFTIDDVKVSGLKAVSSVSLTTGQELHLLALDPALTDLTWSMPGANIESSADARPVVYYTADGSYDVTLKAKKDGADVSYTASSFAVVTGTEPVARILPPATFREATSHNYMVAPLAPVTFRSASTGFPTEQVWVFVGTSDDNTQTQEINGPEATVNYMYQHSWPVGLAVSNSHGSSNDIVSVCAEYEGGITNTLSTDAPTTYDMGDWGVFPGTNTRKITRYAEYFSAPSVPMIVGGAYVYFVDAPSTLSVTDNTSIGVHLYTCKDGKPDKCIDSNWWSVIDLDGPNLDGSLVGTFFEFIDQPVVTDDFFIVIDGFPDYSDECRVSFAMASQRAECNTAFMEIDGQWRSMYNYFEAGKGTSYYVTPVVRHSVITSLPVGDDEILVGKDGGDVEHQIFSYMGYKTPVESDADWCEVVNEPNGLTVDNLVIRCQPNATGADRVAHLKVTDGTGSLALVVRQSNVSGITEVTTGTTDAQPELYNLQGIRVTNPAAGQIYIRRTGDKAEKIRL